MDIPELSESLNNRLGEHFKNLAQKYGGIVSEQASAAGKTLIALTADAIVQDVESFASSFVNLSIHVGLDCF